jgi:acetyl esterase/lipase
MPPDHESIAMVWYPDIPYATAPNVDPSLLSLDVHLLDADAPGSGAQTALKNAPVMMYVHGGGGQRGDKAFSKDLAVKPVYFTKREGFVFVSVNYRLGAAGAYPVAQQDVANAVAWVYKNIAQFGGDPNQIFLSGHSSGANLVARVATVDRFLKNAGLDLSVLKGVITMDGGGYDEVSGASEQAQKRLAATYGPNRSDWEAASPVHNVPKGKYVPPFLLFHIGTPQTRTGTQGGSQTDALAMAAALRSGGHAVDVVELVGKDHNQTSSDLGVYEDPETIVVHRFLAGILKKDNRQAAR